MLIRRFLLGILCWLLAAVAAWTAVRQELESRDHSIGHVLSEVGTWTAGRRTEFLAVSDIPIYLNVGDPVFVQMASGDYRQAGMVCDAFSPLIRKSPNDLLTRRVRVRLYQGDVPADASVCELRYHWTPSSLDWVVRTVLPPERHQEIAALIESDWKQHQAEVLQSLTPVIQESLNRSIRAIEHELPVVMERHRNDFTKLGERYKAEMVRQQILPLVRQNILPIVQQEAQPLAIEIGQRLWERVSLWSFTWRYIYDVSPLPERNAVRKEFDRFLEEEAMPELQSHSDQFVEVIERVVSKVSKDPAVSETLRLSLRQVAEDPEFHAIVWKVVQEAVVENQSLRTSLNDYWRSEAPQQAMRLATTRFEPTVRKIGDLIFGSREGGITPEFSRVLRAQILLKDRQWLVLAPSSTGEPKRYSEIPGRERGAVDQNIADSESSLRIVPASEPMMFPLQFEGTEQSPLSKFP